MNAAVVALLTAPGFEDGPMHDFDRWINESTLDGQPLTDEQRALMESATPADLVATLEYHEAVVEHEGAILAAHNELFRLCRPHMAGTDTMGEAYAKLTPDEQARADELLELIAPDGYIVLAAPES